MELLLGKRVRTPLQNYDCGIINDNLIETKVHPNTV